MERFDERMCCSWDADDVVLEQPRVWQPRALAGNTERPKMWWSTIVCNVKFLLMKAQCQDKLLRHQDEHLGSLEISAINAAFG